jgi:tellurite resistance protein
MDTHTQRASHIKRALATVTAAGLLTLGAAGTAFAAENGPESGSTEKAPAAQEQGRGAHRGLRRAVVKTAADAAAATIGVETSDLRAAIKSGQSVGAFAESKGVSAQSVVDAVTQALNDGIDQAASEGKVTAERAAKAKERVPELAERLVNSVPKRFQAEAPAPAAG